jgi:hypothetical protein
MSRSLFSLLAAGVTVCGVAAVVWAARVVVRLSRSQRRFLAIACLLGYVTVLVLRPSVWPVIDVAVLAGAIAGVLFLERGLLTPGAVMTFLAAGAVADFVSMSGGLSRLLIERHRTGTSDLLLYLTLVAPVGDRVIPIVGIGDLLVGGTAATALLRLGLRPVAVMGAITIGLLSALAYGLWRGGTPALPFIAGAIFLLVVQHGSRAARAVRS